MQKIKKIRLIDSGPRIPDGRTDGRTDGENLITPRNFSIENCRGAISIFGSYNSSCFTPIVPISHKKKHQVAATTTPRP